MMDADANLNVLKCKSSYVKENLCSNNKENATVIYKQCLKSSLYNSPIGHLVELKKQENTVTESKIYLKCRLLSHTSNWLTQYMQNLFNYSSNIIQTSLLIRDLKHYRLNCIKTRKICGNKIGNPFQHKFYSLHKVLNLTTFKVVMILLKHCCPAFFYSTESSGFLVKVVGLIYNEDRTNQEVPGSNPSNCSDRHRNPI